jgi:pimeloyl-ACP methyl ester carboxylesterase
MRLLFALAVVLGFATSAFAEAIPAAVTTDPPPDKDHPAHFISFGLPTHGVRVNAMMYVPGGKGPFPTVILFHGFPGPENNLDLARAMQRDGWNVMLVRMRGSWGSAGHFTFAHCLEDAQAAVAWLRDPATVAKQPVDPSRIVVIGHSMGGWIAGYTSAHDPKIMGAALISAGDWSGDAASEPRKDVIAGIEVNMQTADGMTELGSTTAAELADELRHKGKGWGLENYPKGLAMHPLLMITADDQLAEYDDSIAAAVKAVPGADVTTIHFDTNHGYNDHRIALAGALVNWLDGLAGAAH